MNTYLFYDIETTGLNKAFDQIVQFAAIRTDLLFKEIERYEFMIRPRPDVIYSPEALVTNRIPISDSLQGKCEYEATRQIHTLMNEFGTISLGYNTLGFDDEFLRFSFYRNLLPPYTHQYDKGCHRMDLLPITIIYWLYKRDILKWPEHNGKPSMKLEYLNRQNDLAPGRAHDAMADVVATIELAKRLSGEKEVWNYLADCFIKSIDQNRAVKLPVSFQNKNDVYRMGLMVASEYGSDLFYQIPVLSIGDSIPYSNQSLWLRLDQVELRKTLMETIDQTTWVCRKKFGEPGIILPPLERYWKYLTSERCGIVRDNLNWLQSNPELFEAIVTHHRKYAYPEIPNIDVDAALYQIGFLSPDEQALCREFHSLPLDGKIKAVNRFNHPETRRLSERLLFRNYAAHLPKSLLGDLKTYLKQVNPPNSSEALVDYRGDRRTTPQDALLRIHAMRSEKKMDEEQLVLLDELERYLTVNFQLTPKRV